MSKVWLGLCEQSARSIDGVRRLMAEAIPNGDKLMFVVPPVGKAAQIYCPMFRTITVGAVIVNNDRELVGSRDEWNEFLKAVHYYGGIDITKGLFVVEQHYDKVIYTSGEFTGFSVPEMWMKRRARSAPDRDRKLKNVQLKKVEEIRQLGMEMAEFAAEVNSEREQWEETLGFDSDEGCVDGE